MEESKTDKAGKKSAAEDTQFDNRVSQITRLPLQKAAAENDRRSYAGFKPASTTARNSRPQLEMNRPGSAAAAAE